ncbi:efflux RND transporter periplasmic adaptor subunit [Fundidesulfovibrio soli]|uniref:efflux RND transporter periplasmic adaptor subunit n=1 Tax=Fundidesulfovibrio soli TaxID=2922716 RepID=UPI001FAEFBB0|nr:efflux RND transporter periplasmic adaptor subunit [Fundidesulfovibrio soli]
MRLLPPPPGPCLALLLIASLLAACGREAPPPSVRTVTARTGVVSVEEAVECRSFPAQVESRNSVTLASKLSGAVVEVMAREGAALKAGDPVMRIDDKDLQSRAQGLAASAGQASSEREALEARAAHAKANLERLTKLLAQKVISQDDFEKARTEYLALAREVEAIASRGKAVAAQKEELKSLGAYTRITAPFDGVLARRYVDLGAFVNAGQPLAMIDDVASGFDLVAQVDESLLPGLALGQQIVGALPALGPEPFAAKVSAVVGRVDPATRTFKLKAELPRAGAAQPKAGMYGRVFLPVRTSKKLLLPLDCLRMRGDLPAVFVVGPSGTAEFRVIKPGGHFVKVLLDGKPFLTDSEAFDSPGAPGYVEVLSGLSGGERVVCSATETLRQGDRIAEAGQ